MRSPWLLAAVLTATLSAGNAAAPSDGDAVLLRRVADSVLRQTAYRLIDRRDGRTYDDSRDLPLIPEISIESKFNAWFYQTWVVVDGMRRAGAALAEPTYQRYGDRELAFIHRHLDFFQRQHAAGIKAAPVGDGRLSPIAFYFDVSEPWHLALAPLVAEASAPAGSDAERAYLARVAAFLERAPRTASGAIYRRNGRLMADDAFMTVPLLVRQFRATGDRRTLESAVAQVSGYHDRLFDSRNGLYVHAFDVKAGRPVGQFWGRANGWMLLAEVELLAALPPDHPQRQALLAAFARHCEGLRQAQATDGGWHQLLDHPESWIESSCTGMFVYGLARGVNEGWLDREFSSAALAGWRSLTTKVTTSGDIIDVCGSTDVGDVDYYLRRPRLSGDLHGYGPFLLAGSEIVRLAHLPPR